MAFEYINQRYKVNAAIGKKVKVSGKSGTIKKDMGSYIGVVFDQGPKHALPCHPTSDVEYLD